MIRTMKSISIFCILILMAGCNQSTEPGTDTARYPFSANIEWDYTAEISETNFQSTIDTAAFRDTAYSWTGTIRCSGPVTLHDSIITWELHASETLEGYQASDEYYAFDNDTLRLIAHAANRYTSGFFPKRGEEFSYRVAGRNFHSAEELSAAFLTDGLIGTISSTADSLIFDESPRKILVYPLFPGKSWEYVNSGFFRIEKEVLGTVPIRIGMVSYDTYDILWKWDFGDGTWDSTFTQHDYISTSGLLKRELLISHITVASTANPEGIGTIDIRETYLVTAIKKY